MTDWVEDGCECIFVDGVTESINTFTKECVFEDTELPALGQCTGDLIKTESCELLCPYWGEWAEWGPCSIVRLTEGSDLDEIGHEHRTRECVDGEINNKWELCSAVDGNDDRECVAGFDDEISLVNKTMMYIDFKVRYILTFL